MKNTQTKHWLRAIALLSMLIVTQVMVYADQKVNWIMP